MSAALAASRAGADVTMVERFGCFDGNSIVVGVEGMHWYQHENMIESNGIAREFEERSKQIVVRSYRAWSRHRSGTFG